MTNKKAHEILKQYAQAVDEQFQTGLATEHSYRPALQKLLCELLPQYVVTNEPTREKCGAPDYIITKKQTPVFFVEAKDVFDNDLDGLRSHKEQFERYKSSLSYIIFTDYLDFHVYENGEWTQNVRLMEQQGPHLRLIEENEEKFVAMIDHLASSVPVTINSATKLAQLMAAKARLLAEAVRCAFAEAEKDPEYDNTQLQSQLTAFRNVLIHDLTPEGFADIYAQTVAYGMFAARLHDDTPEDFSRNEAATLIPKTNPFLRMIFQDIAGYDLDERIAWIVDDLAQTFLATNLDRVMKTYTGNALHSDPMIHFYEDFLTAYNPKLRKSKGVWYTPQPVVNFIVRAVDEILQRDFHLSMGLADSSKVKHEVVNDYYDGTRKSQRTITRESHRVQILDPATGTGTFLAEVVRQIYQKFQGMEGVWQSYVEEHLLPRLHGFELLMASYAVAHLKLDLQLRSMGYDSAKAKNQRLRIYLTNSLEECHPDTGTLWASWLSSEATQANHIKRDCPVMVMVGNPPYNNSSTNKGAWILQKINDYKKGLNEKKTNLNDDYVKFIRLAQDYIERNGHGIVGFITNHTYIDAITFREMRRNLLSTFDDIYVIDLHGNVKHKEIAPDGSKDENVFDIQQGTAIVLMVKTSEQKSSDCKVHFTELFGRRELKYEWLKSNSISTVNWEEVTLFKPYYFFVPKDFSCYEEYDSGVKINELFNDSNSGIQTKRDEINIHFTDSERRKLLTDFINEDVATLAHKYGLADSSGWTVSDAKKDLMHNPILTSIIAYRPFDDRYTNYTGLSSGIMGRPRYATLRHMLQENVGLCCIRINNRDEKTYFAVDKIVDKTLLSSKDDISIFPLYLYTTGIDGTEEKVPNLNPEEWAKFNTAVGRDTTPEELLHYIYGVLHSPAYRERYKEFLKIDFPRIPLPVNVDEFESKGKIGSKLIDLHLMRNTHTWQLATTFPEAGDNIVDIITYRDGCVMINNTQYFGNVPEEAWNAYIGGYQPAQKWLKDRKGRTLNYDDINHYRQIIYALTETQRLMQELAEGETP